MQVPDTPQPSATLVVSNLPFKKIPGVLVQVHILASNTPELWPADWFLSLQSVTRFVTKGIAGQWIKAWAVELDGWAQIMAVLLYLSFPINKMIIIIKPPL